MVISTRLGEMLKIRHPILLAPVDVAADGKLAAAVIDRMVGQAPVLLAARTAIAWRSDAWRL